MTTDLTWNAHIHSVSSKVHNALFKLRQHAWLIPRDVKKFLVQALVISHLDYILEKTDSIGKYFGLLSVLLSSMIIVLFMKCLCFAPAGLG